MSSSSAAAAIRRLGSTVRSGAFVVFITGAGISVSSGIPAYRSGECGVWNNYVCEWGTRRKFLSDPESWWNDFWFRTHSEQFIAAEPCLGHRAVSRIMSANRNVRLATQNIDRLHFFAGVDQGRYVELHGAIGFYRCSNSPGGCPYSSVKWLEGAKFERRSGSGRVVPPRCPACSSFLMPMTLLFDETYQSHSYFKNAVALDWLDRCDAVVFVGTSFSVGITGLALSSAAMWGTELYNFNIEPFAVAGRSGPPGGVVDVLGSCEETLPALAAECCPPDRPLSLVSSLGCSVQ